jgi:hypothetical protein
MYDFQVIRAGQIVAGLEAAHSRESNYVREILNGTDTGTIGQSLQYITTLMQQEKGPDINRETLDTQIESMTILLSEPISTEQKRTVTDYHERLLELRPHYHKDI